MKLLFCIITSFSSTIYLVKIFCLPSSSDIWNWSFCLKALTSCIWTLLSHHQFHTLNLFSKSFLCTFVPMLRIRNRTDFFFSPLIFILKWQTKEACIQHPKLDLNVYNEDLRFHPKRSIRNGLSFFQSNTNWTKCVKHLKPQLSRHRATENKRWFPRAGEVRPMLGSVTALDSRPQWVEGDPAGTRRTLWIQHIGLKI